MIFNIQFEQEEEINTPVLDFKFIVELDEVLARHNCKFLSIEGQTESNKKQTQIWEQILRK